MKVAIAQIENSLNLHKNLESIKEFINKARESGVKAIFFPENSLTGYTSNLEELVSITHDNKELLELKSIAKKDDIHIFVGAVLKNEEKLYISYLHIKDEINYYSKTHLGKKEEKFITEGKKLNTFLMDSIKVGTAICIESHIPEIFLEYRLNKVKVMIVPFASPSVAGNRKDIWYKYLLARAYDNGVYVLAMNLTGGIFPGGLLAIDPKGDVIDEYFESNEKMLTLDLDLEFVEKVQNTEYKANYINRRKPRLYKGVTNGVY